MDFSTARQRFYQEINQPDAQIDRAKAALYIAQEDYPDLDVEFYLQQLDQMAAAVARHLPQERYPLRVIKAINAHLYDELGFVGNTDDYYDPRNSFLNQVLERRTGIPITLSLVYLEIAKRLEFPMVGVAMPGHFLIRPVLDDMQVFVDPFHQGEVMFEQDCQERLNQLYGLPVTLQPQFLDAVGAKRFLMRMLGNLKLVYLSQSNWDKTLAAIERMLLLSPEEPMALRDRGLIYYRMGRWVEASHDLERYLAIASDAKEISTIQHLLERMRGQVGDR
ncbi:MAG TPA: transglutaminase-like domain-containing protein [Chroococcidiopsis sp.]